MVKVSLKGKVQRGGVFIPIFPLIRVLIDGRVKMVREFSRVRRIFRQWALGFPSWRGFSVGGVVSLRKPGV